MFNLTKAVALVAAVTISGLVCISCYTVSLDHRMSSIEDRMSSVELKIDAVLQIIQQKH